MRGWKTYLLIGVVALCPLAAIGAVACGLAVDKLLPLLSLAALGMAHLVQDASTDVYDSATALPNGAASTNSAGFDLGPGSNLDRPPNCEIVVGAPLLATGVMGDGKYMYYDLYHDTDSAFGTEAFAIRIGQQLGAGGAGCAAATLRARLPSTLNRYIRVKATGSAAGDCSGSDFTARLLF